MAAVYCVVEKWYNTWGNSYLIKIYGCESHYKEGKKALDMYECENILIEPDVLKDITEQYELEEAHRKANEVIENEVIEVEEILG